MTDRLSDYDGLFLLAATALAIVFGQSLLIAWVVCAWRRDRELRHAEADDSPARWDVFARLDAAVRVLWRGLGNK
jgi:hypothetical protein